MKGFIVLLLCLLPVVSGEIIKFREYEEPWYSWKSFYERKYETDAEEEVRYAIWRDNLRVSSLIVKTKRPCKFSNEGMATPCPRTLDRTNQGS